MQKKTSNNILNIQVFVLLMMIVNFSTSINCLNISTQNYKVKSYEKSKQFLANITNPFSENNQIQKLNSIKSLKTKHYIQNLEKCLGLGFHNSSINHSELEIGVNATGCLMNKISGKCTDVRICFKDTSKKFRIYFRR